MKLDFSNRTDVGTFIPFMHKLEMAHKQRYEEVTTDPGYESLENYLYLCRGTEAALPESFHRAVGGHSSDQGMVPLRGLPELSTAGKMLRTNRSIQVEGAFGLIKNDFAFRRFLTTGKKNVRVELFFLALGFNLKKWWMKQEKRRLGTHYSEKKAA